MNMRLIGRAARIGGLEAVLAHLAGCGDVWVARRPDIAAHWLARQGRP